MEGVRTEIAALERKSGKGFGSAGEPAARFGAVGFGDVDARHDGHDPQPRPQRGDAAGARGQDRQSALRLGCLPALHPALRQDRDGRPRRGLRRGDGGDQAQARRRARRRADRRGAAGARARRSSTSTASTRARRSPPIPTCSSNARSRRCSSRGTASAPSTTGASSGSRRHMANGTAVNVCTMVFGNMGDDSATGVGLHPQSRRRARTSIYGEYLVNAQGEDVVAGIRTPKPIAAMAQEMPALYRQLVELRDKLETHYKEVQDFEFTIERGRLYCLQTRNGKMNARAMVTTSVGMCRGRADREGPGAQPDQPAPARTASRADARSGATRRSRWPGAWRHRRARRRAASSSTRTPRSGAAAPAST